MRADPRLGLIQIDLADKPRRVRFRENLMEMRLDRVRKRAIIVISLAVPFICGLVEILLTGDEVPTQPFYWRLMRIQQFASVLISIAVPLAMLLESRRRTHEKVVTLLQFGGVWFLTQIIAIFALALVSITVDPSPYQ